MKNINKIFSAFLVLLLSFFLVSTINVKADPAELVESIDGASIREEGIIQGLRFYAKVVGDNQDLEDKGFYLLFGKATIQDLEDALDGPVVEGKHQHKGKDVIKVSVPGVTQYNEYSVVLTGIPEKGYLDNITVIPYAELKGSETEFYAAPVTRSIGQVALNMANAGETPPAGILSTISGNYKRVAFNAFGELEITDNLFETNHFLLREEFIKDWNEKFRTTWTTLDATAFYNSAKTGLTGGAGSNKDLSPSNLYKFFNDEVYGDKWMWVLDYIDLKGDVHPRRQIVAIKGDGTNADHLLYNAEHLGYSIPNFFNGRNDSTGYAAINFTSPSKYDSVQNYNDKIYVDVANYEYLAFGDSYTIPAPEARLGYNFVNYKDGETTVNPGAYEITATNRLFAKVYQAIAYDVTFYDDETELTDLNTAYTIENEKVLPVPSIDGKIFEGWYDNAELTGAVVTKIDEGSTGAKTFYGKFVETNNVPVEVTFKLNGGKLNAEQMIEYRTATYIEATRYSTGGDIAGERITVGPSRGGQYWYVMGFKETDVEGVYEFLSKGTNYSNPEATLFISYHDKVKGDYAAAIKALYAAITAGDLVVITWLPPAVTGDTSIDMYFMNSTALTDDVVLTLTEPEVLFTPGGSLGFLGWHDNEELDDPVITSYPGYEAGDGISSVTYYAKWAD